MQGLSVLLLGFLSTSTLCFGQAGRAELFGAIHDPTGLPVLGALLALALGGTRLPLSFRK